LVPIVTATVILHNNPTAAAPKCGFPLNNRLCFGLLSKTGSFNLRLLFLKHFSLSLFSCEFFLPFFKYLLLSRFLSLRGFFNRFLPLSLLLLFHQLHLLFNFSFLLEFLLLLERFRFCSLLL
jgi:hypothetical protein